MEENQSQREEMTYSLLTSRWEGDSDKKCPPLCLKMFVSVVKFFVVFCDDFICYGSVLKIGQAILLPADGKEETTPEISCENSVPRTILSAHFLPIF